METMSSRIYNKCKQCDKEYTSRYRWCKPCQINNFKKNFTNWTSGNEKIDNHIQEMQLKISFHYDIVFEWIPYDQFDNIKEVSKGDFVTVYSAIWKNGPLYYDNNQKEYKRRISDRRVTLKCLYNSQNITEFLNEV